MARANNPNRNPVPKGVKHGEELIQRTRKAVLNAFDAVERRGKVISEILADQFEDNPIKFMELASKLMPKEITGDINHDHKHKHTYVDVSEVDSWIEGIVQRSKDIDAQKTLPN